MAELDDPFRALSEAFAACLEAAARIANGLAALARARGEDAWALSIEDEGEGAKRPTGADHYGGGIG